MESGAGWSELRAGRWDFYRETFGPAVAAYAADPAVDPDFLAFATRRNRGAPDGPSEYHYEYLLVVATKR